MSADRYRELLDDVDNVMLTTTQDDGTLHARPMGVAGRDGDTLWFLTSRSSDKVDEVRADSDASITNQGRTSWLAGSGVARVVDDRDRVEELFSEAMRAWFPDGPSDPDCVALAVELVRGEYWDVSGGDLLSFAYGVARSAVTNEPIDSENAGEHDSVVLGGA